MEATDLSDQVAEAGKGRLNRLIAISVAASAVILTLGNIKDGNIIQSMMQAQAAELDHWNQFQAKSTKQHLYELQIEQWQLAARMGPPAAGSTAQPALEKQIAKWQSEVKRYDGEKADLKKQAEESRASYGALNFRDDQFDFAEALLGLSITLFAIASLTQSRSLYGFGLVIGLGGAIMSLAGFCGWLIHPGVIRFLT
jgi:hypothetical protein